MSTLYLVRHAQASFMAADYDVLSDLGHEQARQLGRRWAELGIELSAVYSGPRRRQRHTAEIVGETMIARGLPFGDIHVLDELDEYHAEAIIQRFAPELGTQDPEIGRLVAGFSEAETPQQRARSFELLFQAVMSRWARGDLDAPDVEAWSAFSGRATRALATLTESDAKGRTVAAFSSGGAIGVAVGTLLDVPPEMMLELGFSLNNCGVCEVRYTRGRRSLLRYNDIAHLPDASHWTHR